MVKRASKHHPKAFTLPLYYRDYSIIESLGCSGKEILSGLQGVHSLQERIEAEKHYHSQCGELKIKNQFEFHRSVKECQENQFAVDINSLAEGETVIVMDFKANITLGRGPEEDSHVFFNAPQRTLFGAVAYLKKGEEIFKVI